MYCAVYKQNKNTLIFPHKIGCVNIGGYGCIQTNRKMHPNSTSALSSRRGTVSTYQAPALVTHAWYRTSKAVLRRATGNAAVEEAALGTDIMCLSKSCLPFARPLALLWWCAFYKRS